MTKKQRVIAALRHQETETVPYQIDLTIPAKERLKDSPDVLELLSKAEMHIGGTQYSGWPTERNNRLRYYTDDFGVTWNRSGIDKDIGVIDRPIFEVPDITLWQDPVLDENRLRAEYQSLIASNSERFTFAGIGFSVFERLWSLCGMENALVYMIEEPGFVHEILDRICDFNIRIIKIANEYPFDGFYFGDDWGQQKGLIMGPRIWREYIMPRIKRMYEVAKKADRYILQHSCGQIDEIFPDLIGIGLDCYQTFQPEIYNIQKVKREFGADLCFWGGISTQQLLPREKPDIIRKECSRIIHTMRKNGGYIAGPTHALTGDIPPENIEAMLNVLMAQDKYI